MVCTEVSFFSCWLQQKELAATDPNTTRDVSRVLSLLAAMGNAGPRFSRTLLPVIAPFTRSKVMSIREAARTVVQSDLQVSVPEYLKAESNFGSDNWRQRALMHWPSSKASEAALEDAADSEDADGDRSVRPLVVPAAISSSWNHLSDQTQAISVPLTAKHFCCSFFFACVCVRVCVG